MMGLVLKNLFSKEDEDITSMPDPKQGIDNLLKKYQLVKDLYDEDPNTGPTQPPQNKPEPAKEEGINDPQASDQNQVLDSEALGKGLIDGAMLPGPDGSADSTLKVESQSAGASSFNLNEALRNSGSLAEISKNMIRDGRFSDDWPDAQPGQPAFSAIPWREPNTDIPNAPFSAKLNLPQAENPKEVSDGRTENEHRFDNQIKAGTFNRMNEISHAFTGQESISGKISNAWDALNYERPDAVEFRAKLMQPANIKVAILDNMLAGPIPAITAGVARWLGWSDSDIYNASQLGIALDGLATSRAAISHPMAYTGAQHMPDLSSPKTINTNKPYANPNSRPPYHPDQVGQVWDTALKKYRDGNVYDPNVNILLQWDTTRSRAGQWDMGHIPGQGYAELHARYMADDITLNQFLKEYRNPKNYRPELPKSNRGRKYEGY